MENITSRQQVYTIEGRYFIHKNLAPGFKESIKFLIDNPIKNESMEKNDNRISLYVAQKGLCHISKQKLNLVEMVIRNKLPKNKGGTDKYHNLILVNKEINVLIDEKDTNKVNQYKEGIKLGKKALDKINALRILVGNPMI